MRLDEIAPDAYVKEVLPQTAHLWAGRRDFDTYVLQTLEIAQGPYGRRHFRTFGLYDGDEMLATFKRYERTLHLNGNSRARRGYRRGVHARAASRPRVRERHARDAARPLARATASISPILFSDIRPQFYADTRLSRAAVAVVFRANRPALESARRGRTA